MKNLIDTMLKDFKTEELQLQKEIINRKIEELFKISKKEDQKKL